MNLSIISLNILAPSLTSVPESNEQFSGRLVRIAEKLQTLFNDADIYVFSEVDEYVENQHVYKTFQSVFPNYSLFYLPKPKSVDTRTIPVRHGTMILISREKIKCYGSFPVTLTDASSMASLVDSDDRSLLIDQNQIINILLLKERTSNQRFVLAGVHLKAGKSGALRAIQIRELLKRVNDLQSFSYKAILVGDFNEPDMSIGHDFSDAYDCSKDVKEPLIPCTRTQALAPALKSSSAKDSKDSDTRLDYIFYRGFAYSSRARIFFKGAEIENYDNNNFSDHFPIGLKFYF